MEINRMDDKVLRNFTYGLFLITARDGSKMNGCIVNTGIQASSEPLTVAVSVNKADYTQKTGEFNLTFLSEESDFATFKHFGYQSGRDVDKFEKFEYKLAANGIPYITKGANSYLSAKVVKSVDLGSHTLFVAEITDGEILGSAPSVSYSYYFEHIKPKPEEKKADGEKKVGCFPQTSSARSASILPLTSRSSEQPQEIRITCAGMPVPGAASSDF